LIVTAFAEVNDNKAKARINILNNSFIIFPPIKIKV